MWAGGPPKPVHPIRVHSLATVPSEAWGLGGGIISTASVAAAAARLYAGGRMPYVGALPPERCIEPEALFQQLEARGCTFDLQVREVTRSESR